MKAIGTTGKSINDFIEFELKKPELKAHDVLLLNLKFWDGIGTVVEIGKSVTLFQIGDYVFERAMLRVLAQTLSFKPLMSELSRLLPQI